MVILDSAIIITDQLHPSSLLEIKLFLSEHILGALIVNEDLILFSIKMVPLNFQSENNSYQLEIMSRIVHLMGL